MFKKKLKGASLTSYALLVGLIGIVAILAITRVGEGTSGLFVSVANRLDGAVSGNLGGSSNNGGSGGVPVVSISTPSGAVAANEGDIIAVTLQLSEAPTANMSVNYAISGTSSGADSADFSGSISGTANFTGGGSDVINLSFTVNDRCG